MKKSRFIYMIIGLWIISCTKTETVTIEVQELRAQFVVTTTNPIGSYVYENNRTSIDSNFYFVNKSDTGTGVNYKWDFGDGSTSDEKNPKHSYGKRGNYTVTLTVTGDHDTKDTAKQTVGVFLGQRLINFGDNYSVYPVAIHETATNDFVLLTRPGYNATYNLLQLDSLLQEKSRVTFPAAYHFSSMNPTTDGNYILTGSVHSADKGNDLVKIKADGTELWNKTLGINDGYSSATQAPDGGYVVIGSRQFTSPTVVDYYTVVIKTDANGNQQWEKWMDQEGMVFTKNAVIEPDGIVLAGVKRGNCSECDSIIIAKLNNSGTLVWKNVVLGGMNNFVWWDTRIQKFKTGNYAVTNGYTRGIFFFSPSGTFVDRPVGDYQVAAVSEAADGNIIVLQTESGNGSTANITKLSLDGAHLWQARVNGSQKVAGGYSCCASSWPVDIAPLHSGGTITLAYRADYNSNNNIHTVIALLELEEDGNLK